MLSWIRSFALAVTAGVALLGAGPGLAQYPERPVKLIVTWPPGGSADALGRQLANGLSIGLSQSVVVENIPGASGNVGNGVFARAPADGYTLLLATSSTNSAAPSLFHKLPFHPVDDFVPIALAVIAPSVLVVRAESPYKSVKDVIDAAKAKPGKLSFASGGSGNSGHLSASLFATELGLELLHVPYRGNAPAMTDLLGGQVDIMFDNNAVAMIKSGRLRGLAATSDQRIAALPDVPTFKELGHSGVVLTTWYGIAAPKGTPPAIVDKVQKALFDGMKKADTAKRLEDMAFQTRYLGSTEFGDFWKREIERYRELVRISGAKAE